MEYKSYFIIWICQGAFVGCGLFLCGKKSKIKLHFSCLSGEGLNKSIEKDSNLNT